MYRSLLAGVFCLAGFGAHATDLATFLVQKTHPLIKEAIVSPMARFTVGDTANYDLKVSSFGGTMVMKVTAVDSSGVTIEQLADLGMLGKQDIIEVIDPATGQIKSVTANGQKQTPPDPNDIQILSIDLATITVKAGTFKCQDVKMHMKSENTDGEQWADMDDVPVGGMLKMTTTQQGMPVELELTSFHKGP
jgi:hypothetical protein